MQDTWKIPGVGNGNPLTGILAWEFHGHRSLVGYSPWGCKQPNTTEQQSTTHMVWDGHLALLVHSLKAVTCVPSREDYEAQ